VACEQCHTMVYDPLIVQHAEGPENLSRCHPDATLRKAAGVAVQQQLAQIQVVVLRDDTQPQRLALKQLHIPAKVGVAGVLAARVPPYIIGQGNARAEG
jgi:hypothetical protein